MYSLQSIYISVTIISVVSEILVYIQVCIKIYLNNTHIYTAMST